MRSSTSQNLGSSPGKWRGSICAMMAIAWLIAGCRSTVAPADTPTSPSSQTPVAASGSCDSSSPPIALSALQGNWKVASSSGKPDQGHVFLGLVGEMLLVKGSTLVVPDYAFDTEGRRVAFQSTKTITLAACTSPQAIDLEQTRDAKGWSRIGVVRLEGNRLTLCVQFPGRKRPESLAPADDGREIAALERLP